MEMKPIGRLLRAARLASGTTLAEMADHMGMKPSYICAVEVGKLPCTDTFILGAAAFFSSIANRRDKDRNLIDWMKLHECIEEARK